MIQPTQSNLILHITMAITIIDITIVPISMIQISIIQQSMISTTLPNTFSKCLLLLLTILLLIPAQSTVKNFGMNKPHFLFHLGDRRPISTNIGWGYWSDSSPLRMKYANTQDQLYAHMTVHDGQNFFMQRVEDRRNDLVSDIRYQSNEQSWEVQIQMQNKGSNLTTWFMYYSVENNDYKLIDHEKHTSYIYLVPQKSKQSKSTISTKVLSYAFPNQTFSLSQTIAQQNENILSQANNIRLFGLTANISQTYAVLQIAETFKHLVKVSRGEESIQERQSGMPPKDKKILDWQSKQVEFIKEDKWEEKSYVVLFLYGVVAKGQNCKIYLTNSTAGSTQFNHKQFKERQANLESKYFPTPSPKYHDFLKHTVSNLYAGLTFYYGRLYTQNSLTVHRQDYSYSFTPSRLIFPRSFLWDDGFHQSVIVHYNPYIIIDVLNNWMNKVDIFGWIGREQIRGGEISSMMPDSRFVFQDWFQMNPPTLIMSIQSLLQKSRQQKKLSDQVKIFLMNNFHKLELWYRYFKNTQSHQSLEYPETMNITDRFYRWHCKDECSKGNFMGSGLDDYPRRNQQAQIAKQHVDLVSWLYFFADGLEKIGKFLEQVQQKQIINEGEHRIRNKYTRRVKYYQKQVEEYLHSLYESFYDKDDFLFKDIVVVRSDLFIQRFVNKIGYINLFPFFTGMLSQSNGLSNEDKRVKSLKKCLQIMSDEKLLLSEDGLRSLSFSDPLYGTDDNYWRGAVWLPINYMVLRACKKYYWNDSKLGKQIQELYVQLRQKLINSVYNTYKETGYLYQNYYEGRGHRGYPFYGWTSTIVNIITEQY